MPQRRSRCVPAAAALAGLTGLALGDVHVLLPGQGAFGTIAVPGEVDLLHFHAEPGWALDFTIRARAGESPPLHPILTRLEDPDGVDLLPAVPVKSGRSGTSVHAGRFKAAKSGDYILGISGDLGTTGTWDLVSRGPASLPLGGGTVAGPGGEVALDFDVDAGTTARVRVKAASGSPLHPLVARLERPAAAGDADLSGAERRTTAREDRISNLLLGDDGTWSLVVTGAASTTGAFTAFLRPGRTPALDFSVDAPDPGPPPAPAVASVAPAVVTLPESGTAARAITVTGSHFGSGAAVALAATSGTNGISNIQASFTNAASLAVTFDLSSAATPGPRTVTVTNPDLQAGTKVGAFTLEAFSIFSVVSVTPSTGPGAGGTRVLVQGAKFDPDAVVTFGGLPARSVNVVDSRNILCTVPAAAFLSKTAPTPVAVTVDNGGGSTASLANGYAYAADGTGPVVVSTVPAVGAAGVATNEQATVLVLNEPLGSATVVPGNFDFFRDSHSGTDDITAPRVLAATLGVNPRMIVLRRGAAAGGNLSPSSLYVFQINDASVTDVAGNGFDALHSTPVFSGPGWQGTWGTASSPDFARPAVSVATPAKGATGVGRDAAPTLLFGEAVDPSTVAGAVTLRKAGTPVTVDLDIDAACRTVTILPRRKLAAATTYTLGVSGALKDLAGNGVGPSFSSTFTTAPADATAPVQTLTVDSLPQDVNGSGTCAAGTSNGGATAGSGAPTAFDVVLPRSGFTIDLVFEDSGGAGVDASTFAFTCSAAMGSVGAGQDLAPLFTATPMGASWTVDPAHALAAGADVAFTANVKDGAGNAAPTKSLTVDVEDITKTIADTPGTPSTDRDPFNTRQTWLLRFDQDLYTTTLSAGGTGQHSRPVTVSSALAANGTSDFEEDLALLGLSGPETGTNAATVTNGGATGTKAIVRKLVKAAVRGHLNERYGMVFVGARTGNSVEIEFLLEGETRTGGGTVTFAGWSPASGYSMMTFTGDERPNASGGVLGRAAYDLRNTAQESDSNTGNVGGNNVGVFATHMIRVRINDPDASSFPRTFDPLIATAGRGGTPVGSDNLDGTVLAGTFVYASASAPERARYDVIATAIDKYALYLSAVGAHEIGHSSGVVADGAPPLGLFGNAHPANTFIASGAYTTTAHIDTPGPNLMAAAASYDEEVATGADFDVFEPMSLQYLLRRLIYDQ